MLRGLLREGFDVDRIGRFVLGKYRRTSSQEEINEFIGVFEKYIVVLYAKQFAAFTDVNFAVEKVIKTKLPKDSMVTTKISPANGTETYRVDFQVRKLGDKFKILDVRFEGVSLILAQRDEFSAYIGNNGGKIATLTAALRQRLGMRTDTLNPAKVIQRAQQMLPDTQFHLAADTQRRIKKHIQGVINRALSGIFNRHHTEIGRT